MLVPHASRFLDRCPGTYVFVCPPSNSGNARIGRLGLLRPVKGHRCRREYSFCLRSEEHTYELQTLMRILYAVFCFKITKNIKNLNNDYHLYVRPDDDYY